MKIQQKPIVESSNTVTFVILHYLAFDVTVKCIESILNVLTYKNYYIVVVDNGSNNNTGEKLEKRYKRYERIKIIILADNLGFSAGNNIGYVYAKKHIGSDYIFIINNDTEMIQGNFVEEAIKCFETTSYFVLGPDIIHFEGIHQSPLRDHIITRAEARKWYIKRNIFGKYLRIHKLLRLPENFYVCRKFLENDLRRKANLSFDYQQENIELQGACIIFSPLYIAKNENAFEELTFMYCEEILLSLRCMKNNWKIIYSPELRIMHMEKSATNALKGNIVDREIFCSDNMVKALRIVLKRIKEQDF